MTALEAARSISLDRWADWGEPERLVVNISNIYAELSGDPEPLNPVVAFEQMAELARSGSSYSNSGALQPGRMSGSPSLTRSGNRAARFSRNEVTPSTASADCPRESMPRESARWASIGCSAPSIVHSMRRASATETGAVFSAISSASSRAAPSSCAGWVQAAQQPALETLLRGEHPAGGNPLHRAADANGARQKPARGRLGDDAAAGEHEAHARVLSCEADVHRQRHRGPDADGRAVDRGDHRLGRREYAQRELAAVVARNRLGRPACAVVESLATGGEIGARAEAAARAGDDDHAHVIVGVGLIECLVPGLRKILGGSRRKGKTLNWWFPNMTGLRALFRPRRLHIHGSDVRNFRQRVNSLSQVAVMMARASLMPIPIAREP